MKAWFWDFHFSWISKWIKIYFPLFFAHEKTFFSIWKNLVFLLIRFIKTHRKIDYWKCLFHVSKYWPAVGGGRNWLILQTLFVNFSKTQQEMFGVRSNLKYKITRPSCCFLTVSNCATSRSFSTFKLWPCCSSLETALICSSRSA